MIDRILVDIQQPSGGPDTQAPRQSRRPTQVRVSLGADARIGRARAGGNQRTACVTLKPGSVPMPAPILQPRVGRHLSIQHTLRVATVACPVVHRGRPSAALICEGYLPPSVGLTRKTVCTRYRDTTVN